MESTNFVFGVFIAASLMLNGCDMECEIYWEHSGPISLSPLSPPNVKLTRTPASKAVPPVAQNTCGGSCSVFDLKSCSNPSCPDCLPESLTKASCGIIGTTDCGAACNAAAGMSYNPCRNETFCGTCVKSDGSAADAEGYCGTEGVTTTTTTLPGLYLCKFEVSEDCCYALDFASPIVGNLFDLSGTPCDEDDIKTIQGTAVCEEQPREGTCGNEVDSAKWHASCRGDLDLIGRPGDSSAAGHDLHCVSSLGDPDEACMQKLFLDTGYAQLCANQIAHLMTCAVSSGKSECSFGAGCIGDPTGEECRTCGEKAMIDHGCVKKFETGSGVAHCPYNYQESKAPQKLYLRAKKMLTGSFGLRPLAVAAVGAMFVASAVACIVRRRASAASLDIELLPLEEATTNE